MRTLALLSFLLPAVAHAEAPNVDRHVYFNAGQSYAIRAICPPRGEVNLLLFLPGYVFAQRSNGSCVFNRIGMTFDTPAGGLPVQEYIAIVSADVWEADTKLTIEPDCGGGPTTTCSAVVPGTIAGKFTYPGDQDWIRLSYNAVNITPKPNRPDCFVSASVVELNGDDRFAVFVGGPSGCGYTATIAQRIGVE